MKFNYIRVSKLSSKYLLKSNNEQDLNLANLILEKYSNIQISTRIFFLKGIVCVHFEPCLYNSSLHHHIPKGQNIEIGYDIRQALSDRKQFSICARLQDNTDRDYLYR